MMQNYRAYLELCKPRVVLLMLFTSLVGMFLAPTNAFPYHACIFGSLGIAFIAASAATLNQIADQHIDKLMRRTQNRPLVQGKVSTFSSILFALSLCILGVGILIYWVNMLTAILTVLSLIGYAFCYTLYLKHKTPQNIVIGGLAGAVPPLLGWTAVTNNINAEALLLVLIIYVWTPPHFWALAIARLEDYQKANVPMLPLTHGITFTKLNIILYTVLLTCVSQLPYWVGMSGLPYFVGIMTLNIIFLYFAYRLYYTKDKGYAIRTFRFSIHYLGLLFLLLLCDHFL